jgi:hypothetical protein
MSRPAQQKNQHWLAPHRLSPYKQAPRFTSATALSWLRVGIHYRAVEDSEGGWSCGRLVPQARQRKHGLTRQIAWPRLRQTQSITVARRQTRQVHDLTETALNRHVGIVAINANLMCNRAAGCAGATIIDLFTTQKIIQFNKSSDC